MMNIGIIGLGGVGEVLLQAFLKHPQTMVKYLYDANPDRLFTMSETYHIQSVDSYQDILVDPTIDVVYLAVPPKFHHAIALDIIKSGKHIFCEKPLANSLEEAQEIVTEVNRSNVKHVMNFPTIYRPAFLKFKEYLENNEIGELLEVTLQATFEEWPRSWQKNNWISSREQGGFVKEVFPHFIQIILSLFGEIDIEKSELIYPEDPALSELSITASGTANRIPLSFDAKVDPNLKEEISFTIKGSSGAVTLYNWRELFFGREPITLEVNDHLQLLIDAIVAHLEGQQSTVITFHDGLKIQKVLEDLIEKGS